MNPSNEPLSDELAGELSNQLIATLKLMLALRNQAPRVDPRVDPAGYPILFLLHRCGPTRVSALAEALHSDVSTVSRQAAALVCAGVVTKTVDDSDRRVQVLSLDEAGCNVLAALQRQRHEWFDTILADWEPSDLEHFHHFLLRFTTDMRAHWSDLTGRNGVPSR